MIGSSLPLCYPQIAVSDLLDPRALCFFSPLTKHIRLVGLLLRSVRVFREFAWLKSGSGKVALSRPTHQYPFGA
jgi:hypothetical protein